MDSETLDRVRALVRDSGLPQQDFAQRVGMAPDKLSKSLNGRRNFSSFELAMIADASSVTVDWILTGAAAPAPAVAARALLDEAIDSDAIEGVARRFADAHTQLDLLARRAELPRLPTVSKRVGFVRAGESLARWALGQLALGGFEVVDADQPRLLEALEQRFGIDAAVADLPWGLDGYSWQTESLRLLIVARSPMWSRQRFSIAHELGHILAHDAQELIAETVENHSTITSEKRANAFAAAFLMPEGFLRACASTGLDQSGFDGLVARLLVSPRSLGWRLFNLGLISEAERLAWSGATAEQCVMRSGRSDVALAARERALIERLPPRLVRGHLDAYERGETSARPLAALLGVGVSDIIATYGR